MKTVLFLRRPNTYLPEIPAYLRYLEGEMPEVKAYDSADFDDFKLDDFDVIWRFPGLDRIEKERYVVHEYNSLSTGRFPVLKNRIKKWVNKIPDRRVFLNKIVHHGFKFSDDVPYAYRDMGVALPFFQTELTPEYDFVYAGSVYRGSGVLRFIDYFAQNIKNATLLIVGHVNKETQDQYKNFSNITFSGRIPYEKVPSYIAKGRHGLNIVPDRYPYNVQTATKVLEYCALGLPVVSLKYRWIEGFAGRRDGRFFWMEPDFSNFSLKAVENFSFKTPPVTDKRWRNVIASSGVFDFLKTL